MPTSSITRRILVPLDGGNLSVSVLPYLRALTTPDSEIVLLRVVPDATSLLTRLSGSFTDASEVLRRSHAASEDYLTGVGENLRADLSRITALTRIGHPADEIVNVSEELDVDLIVMATNAHGPIGRMILGSVADRVAQSATMPVMLVRPHPLTIPLAGSTDVPIQRVVVPLDGSDRATAALPVATRLALQLKVPVQLIRVISLEDHLDLEADALEQEYTALLDAASSFKETIAAELEHEALRLRQHGIETSVEVRNGSAARCIIDALEPGDLVVMTSHGEGGVRRWLVGSVANKVIQQSIAPLVMVPSAERVAIATSIQAAPAQA